MRADSNFRLLIESLLNNPTMVNSSETLELRQGIKIIESYDNYNKIMAKIYSHDKNLEISMDMDSCDKLTEEQLKEINNYWGKFSFAFNNNPKIQACYSTSSGIYSHKYMSEGLQWWYMWRFCEDLKYRDSFHDKNYFDLLTPGVKHPCVIIRKICNSYYDGKRNIISLNQAIDFCIEAVQKSKAKKLIVKPSAGGGGYGIQFIREETNIATIRKLLSVKNDLIIEDILFAHESYEKFHPSSLNSIRIVSLLYNNEVTIISSLFRMGRNSFELDNYSQGGISCGINSDGTLKKYAFDKYRNRYLEHPDTQEKFENSKLESYGKVIQKIKKLHPLLPQLKHISWDFCVDKEGEPVLIEFNTRGDVTMIQQNGSLPYGKYTDEILEDWLYYSYKIIKSNWDYDFLEYRDRVEIQRYTGKSLNVIIPDFINDKPVTAINKGAFHNESKNVCFNSIVLPKTIKFVSAEAFQKPNTFPVLYPDEFLIAPKYLSFVFSKTEKAIRLSWEKVQNATAYKIFRICDTEESLIAEVNSNESHYIDKDINIGKSTAKYCVQAVNNEEKKISGKTYSARVRLHEINGIKLSNIGPVLNNTAIKIIWEKDPYAKQYIVCRESGGETSILSITDNTSYIDKKIKYDTPYIYFVYPNEYHDLRGAKSREIIVCK